METGESAEPGPANRTRSASGELATLAALPPRSGQVRAASVGPSRPSQASPSPAHPAPARLPASAPGGEAMERILALLARIEERLTVVERRSPTGSPARGNSPRSSAPEPPEQPSLPTPRMPDSDAPAPRTDRWTGREAAGAAPPPPPAPAAAVTSATPSSPTSTPTTGTAATARSTLPATLEQRLAMMELQGVAPDPADRTASRSDTYKFGPAHHLSSASASAVQLYLVHLISWAWQKGKWPYGLRETIEPQVLDSLAAHDARLERERSPHAIVLLLIDYSRAHMAGIPPLEQIQHIPSYVPAARPEPVLVVAAIRDLATLVDRALFCHHPEQRERYAHSLALAVLAKLPRDAAAHLTAVLHAGHRACTVGEVLGAALAAGSEPSSMGSFTAWMVAWTSLRPPPPTALLPPATPTRSTPRETIQVHVVAGLDPPGPQLNLS